MGYKLQGFALLPTLSPSIALKMSARSSAASYARA